MESTIFLLVDTCSYDEVLGAYVITGYLDPQGLFATGHLQSAKLYGCSAQLQVLALCGTD